MLIAIISIDKILAFLFDWHSDMDLPIITNNIYHDVLTAIIIRICKIFDFMFEWHRNIYYKNNDNRYFNMNNQLL